MNTIEDIELSETTEYESFNYLIDSFNSDSPDELDDIDPDYELIDFLSKYDLQRISNFQNNKNTLFANGSLFWHN